MMRNEGMRHAACGMGKASPVSRMPHTALRMPIVLMALIVWSCAQPPASSAPMKNTSGPHVTLPDGYSVSVEIAADDETRAQGLMFRDSLREGTGMLFLFAKNGDYPFWMQNTLIPLDMIWIDENHKVVHVASDVPPCKADPCPSYPPNAPARYVLELAAGMAKTHRVVAGSTVTFQGTENLIVR
jgi:uncharacterized membrane protein (UPF0127 family)